MLSSHVKISPLIWLHNKPHLSAKNYLSKMVWYFIDVYIIKTEHYMVAWRYEISFLVLEKIFFNNQREISYLRAVMYCILDALKFRDPA